MVDSKTIGVLCVDDNEHVAEALRVKLRIIGGFEWKGWLADADELVEAVEELCPDVVLLDIDMPGADPFVQLGSVSELCPDTRVLMFSGHVRRELVDKAIEGGAWGYVSKNDGEDALVAAICAVAAGQFILSPEVRLACERE